MADKIDNADNKKGLSAFLKKQQKKKKEDKVPQAKISAGPGAAEEIKAAGEETQVKQDADVIQSQDQKLQKDNAKDGDSSGSEEEESGPSFTYGKIIDKQDAQRKIKQEEKHAIGMGFEDQIGPKGDKSGADGKETKQKTRTTEIRFGSKPTFGNKRTKKLNSDFMAGLDDDDDGDIKQGNKDGKGGENGAADGGPQFINLGASARAGGDRGGKHFEEAKNSDKPAVKPTFTGKFNARGGNRDEDNTGVVTNYGFSVALRGQHDKDKPDTANTGKDGDGHLRKDGRKNRDKGLPFQTAAKQHDGSDDDGFHYVQGDRKRRNQKQKARNSDSDSDEDTRPATRGAFRGGSRGGRGGFFKNSKRDAAVAGKEGGQ